jgi:hypothetical protein
MDEFVKSIVWPHNPLFERFFFLFVSGDLMLRPSAGWLQLHSSNPANLAGRCLAAPLQLLAATVPFPIQSSRTGLGQESTSLYSVAKTLYYGKDDQPDRFY